MPCSVKMCRVHVSDVSCSVEMCHVHVSDVSCSVEMCRVHVSDVSCGIVCGSPISSGHFTPHLFARSG